MSLLSAVIMIGAFSVYILTCFFFFVVCLCFSNTKLSKNSFRNTVRVYCQTVCVQNRLDNLLGLIWVQTVGKGYQQAKLAGKEVRIRARNNE